MPTIKQISEQANHTANANGFWDEKYNLSEKLMLIVSEIAEAQEADRKDLFANLSKEQIAGIEELKKKDFKKIFNLFVKDTFEDELADATIRIFDLAFQGGIDLEKHILLKMKYNSLRPFKHGKKY